jgi:heme exporter protein D
MFSWLGLAQLVLSLLNNISQYFRDQSLIAAGRAQEKARNAEQTAQNKMDGDAAARDVDALPELDNVCVPTDDGFRRD